MDAKPAPKPARRLVSLVLPVYNEKGNLQALYDKIVAAMAGQSDDIELVFVDDGSADGSFEVLRELQARDRRVRVVVFRRNFGKAAAYSAGFRHARGQVIVTMDTDLQDDPAEIPDFLRKIDAGYDLVTGWKHEGKGRAEKALPSKFFNRVVARVTGVPLHDFNCPFKAYRREVLDEIDIHGELHRFIPVLAVSRGFTCAEIRIRNLPRGYGRSKYGFERYVRGMFDLLTVVFITRFSKRPMHLLGLGGLAACAPGSAVLVFLAAAHALFRHGLLDAAWRMRDQPALSLGVLLIIVGVQFFSIGLVGELLVTALTARARDDGYSIRPVLEF